MSTVPFSGVNSRFFSVIPLFHFSIKMSRFFFGSSSWKKCTLCALLSVKWNSDDSATSFQCSAKLIRSAKLYNYVCFGLFVPRRPRVKDIPGYRSSGKIDVDSRRCTRVPVAPPGVGKNTNSRFFVHSVPLFRSLMLTPMPSSHQETWRFFCIIGVYEYYNLSYCFRG